MRGRAGGPVLLSRAMSTTESVVAIRHASGHVPSLTLLREGITDILSRRRLIRYLVSADMKKRGSDTILGNLWWIHQRVEDVPAGDLGSRFAEPAAQEAMAYVQQSLASELSSHR